MATQGRYVDSDRQGSRSTPQPLSQPSGVGEGLDYFFARFDLCGIRATTRVLNSIGRVADF